MARIKLTKYQEKEYQAVKDTLILRNRREYLNMKKDIRKVNRYYNRAYVESGGLTERFHISSKLRTHQDDFMLRRNIDFVLSKMEPIKKQIGRGRNRHEVVVNVKMKQSYKDFFENEVKNEKELIMGNFEALFEGMPGGEELVSRIGNMSTMALGQFLNMYSNIKHEVYYYDQHPYMQSDRSNVLKRLQVSDINVSTINGYLDQFDKRMHYKY